MWRIRRISSLRDRLLALLPIPAGTEGKLAAFLAGDDSAVEGLASDAGEGARATLSGFRDQVRGEQNLVIIFGSEIRGGDIASLVKFGSGIPGAKFFVWRIMPTRAGRRIWVFILICCLDIIPLLILENLMRSGVRFLKLPG